MNKFKKIGKLSGFVVIIFIIFISGFYVGFNKIPEVKKVYGLDGLNIPKELESVDFNEFWKAWNLINEKHPSGLEVSTEEKIWGAIKGLTGSLDDPYTLFFTPKEAEELNIGLSGEFYGVGMEIGIRNNKLIIITPIKGSPAEKAGIERGDVIVKIDDELSGSLTAEQAVALIRGERGTSVKLTIIRETETEPIEISIVRDLIKIPTIETQFRDDGVFVISLFDFSRNSEKDFEKALDEFINSKSKKLVIDLRGNPGGYLGSSINITSWFLESGKPIVIEKSSKVDRNTTYRSNGNFLTGDYSLVVLVDKGSASASEIMAGALQEHKVAKLVGTKTFGKGSVQELIHFKDKTELKITIAEWLTPNGNSISKNGLIPDVVVEFDREAYLENKYDNQLEEAVRVLLEKS